MIKRHLKRLVNFIDGLTLNQIRFGMWFIVGLTAICLSPFMTAKLVSLLYFVSGLIVLVWSFSWLYE
jgi:hypothetical protein